MKKRIPKIKKKYFILFLSISLLLFALNLFWNSIQIKKIFIVSPVRQVNGMSVFNGQNIIFFNNNRITDTLLTSNIYLKNINLKKKFPSTIFLDLTWRTPYAEIISSSSPFFVDNQGFPALSEGNLTGTLPQINMPRMLVTDKNPDWRVLKALSLLNQLSSSAINCSRLTFDEANSQITVLIEDSVELLIPYNFDPARLTASLQIIISRFRIEGKFIRSIDFRFEKPLVILKNE